MEDIKIPIPDKKVDMNVWIRLFGVRVLSHCFGTGVQDGRSDFRVTVHLTRSKGSKSEVIEASQNLGFNYTIRVLILK